MSISEHGTRRRTTQERNIEAVENSNDVDGTIRHKDSKDYRNKGYGSCSKLKYFAILCVLSIAAPWGFRIKDVETPGVRRVNEKDIPVNKVTYTGLSKEARLSIIEQTREEFYLKYGGKESSTKMREKGILSTVDGIRHTARRILISDGTFKMSFGGYSVTVGRGNLFSQSYPFILESILSPVFKDVFHLDLVVKNAAIGGIPSFPYGWCLPNFLGNDADIVSWDYGMNEGREAAALEAYLRQTLNPSFRNGTSQVAPMMIMLDTNTARVNLLKKYANIGAAVDSIAVGRKEIVPKEFLSMKEKERPTGFQRWEEWGAPIGSPGQSSWHPKFKEHEMIGWILAMHFLDAMEEAIILEKVETSIISKKNILTHQYLPKPVFGDQSKIKVSSLLYGKESTEHRSSGESVWRMNKISCRTSFKPVVSGTMSSIIVSGVVGENLDELASRENELYGKGWVLDVGKVERDTKRKVNKVNDGEGMGYIDMKLALYGTSDSGTLRLWLPYEGEHAPNDANNLGADNWFNTIVLCEVNEKRGDKECSMESDVSFTIGGIESSGVTKVDIVASYLNKRICVNVPIPPTAVLTSRTNIKSPDGMEDSVRFPILDQGRSDGLGLLVDVQVRRKSLTRSDGACSISHVIWESH